MLSAILIILGYPNIEKTRLTRFFSISIKNKNKKNIKKER